VIPPVLEQLLNAPGPPGQEEQAAQVWRDAARQFGEVSSDVLGSSWVRVPGTADGPLLAIVGHIDEIAVVVTHVADDGMLAVRQLGGFDPRTVVSQRVEVLTRDGRVPGIVAARKKKTRRGDDPKAYEFSDLFVDIGAKTGEEARTVVRPGDAAIIAGSPLELRNGRVASRSLDNRLGSYVALEVARRVAEAGGAPGDVAGTAAV
jgi:putative aminopeptidase FrvX